MLLPQRHEGWYSGRKNKKNNKRKKDINIFSYKVKGRSDEDRHRKTLYIEGTYYPVKKRIWSALKVEQISKDYISHSEMSAI